jgi:hypothetical protein
MLILLYVKQNLMRRVPPYHSYGKSNETTQSCIPLNMIVNDAFVTRSLKGKLLSNLSRYLLFWPHYFHAWIICLAVYTAEQRKRKLCAR